MRGQVLEIDCDEPALAIPALREMGVFEEVALYGALIHAVAPDVSAAYARDRGLAGPGRSRCANDGRHRAVAGGRLYLQRASAKR